MAVADAGHDSADMSVLAIEAQTPLRVIPGYQREATLDRRDRIRLQATFGRAGSTGGDVKPDCLRMWGEGRKMGAPAPGGKVLPVRCVGFAGVDELAAST